jgi:hypothetical protein
MNHCVAEWLNALVMEKMVGSEAETAALSISGKVTGPCDTADFAHVCTDMQPRYTQRSVS